MPSPRPQPQTGAAMTASNGLNDAMQLAAAAEAETRYRLQFARELSEETGRREYERGLHEGYLLAIADLKAFQHGAVKDAEIERRRWHLCCPRCRLRGHRDGCRDCQDRTRETFGHTLPGEAAPGEIRARALASWKPYSLSARSGKAAA